MKELEHKKPAIYQHIMEDRFVVSRSQNRLFNPIPRDQALEQSINRVAKRNVVLLDLPCVKCLV